MGVLLLRNTPSAPRHRFDATIRKVLPFPRVRRTQWRSRAGLFARYLAEPTGVRRRNTRRKWHTSKYPNPPTLTEKPTQDKSSESRASPACPDSHPARCNQAAAPALHPFNAATCAKTEGHIDDTKVVNPQPAEKPTDMLPQLFALDAQLLSLRQAPSWYRVCDRWGGASQQHNPGRSRRR